MEKQMKTTFERVGDAMAYLESAGVADQFNTTESHDIAGYLSSEEPGADPRAVIHESVNGVSVEYRADVA
jgi:hypothetical protein